LLAVRMYLSVVEPGLLAMEPELSAMKLDLLAV
jgi:hypothetical protein